MERMKALAAKPRDFSEFFLQDEQRFTLAHVQPAAEETQRLAKISESDLSPDQKAAYDCVFAWLERGKVLPEQEDPNLLTLGGFAGVGKTALVALIAQNYKRRVAFAAYTGKAVGVLRKKLKDLNVIPEFCGTLHSLLYKPVEDETTGEVHWAKKTKLGFTDEDGQQVGINLLIIDEASMVPEHMLEDLQTFGVRILGVGDHGQLPPVGGSGELMKRPHLRLEKIHRQAETNPIIRLSACIRETGLLLKSAEDGDKIRYVDRRKVGAEIDRLYSGCFEAALLDRVMLTYSNADRVKYNAEARKAYFGKSYSETPLSGDLVICLKNTDVAFEYGADRIYNGLRGLLRTTMRPNTPTEDPLGLDYNNDHRFLASYEFPEFEHLGKAGASTSRYQWGQPSTFGFFNELHQFGFYPRVWDDVGDLFDFGYALTCHKFQGSSASDVLVLNDRPGNVSSDGFKRWLYTAVTRASERLTVLL